MSYTANNWPAGRWPNFSFAEMACSETGECDMDKATMDRLQLLLSHYGSPLTITSGYRSPRHSIEAAKATGSGSHVRGRAGDVACAGVDAFEVLTEALAVGFTGIGVKQKGEHRFLHLDGPRAGRAYSTQTDDLELLSHV